MFPNYHKAQLINFDIYWEKRLFTTLKQNKLLGQIQTKMVSFQMNGNKLKLL